MSVQTGAGQLSARNGKSQGRLGWVCSSYSSHTGYPLPHPGDLTQHPFSQASQAEVGSLEGLTPLLIEGQLLALDEDGATALQHTLWSALHHQHVPWVPWVLQCVDGQLWARERKVLWARSRGGGALSEEHWKGKVRAGQVHAKGRGLGQGKGYS